MVGKKRKQAYNSKPSDVSAEKRKRTEVAPVPSTSRPRRRQPRATAKGIQERARRATQSLPAVRASRRNVEASYHDEKSSVRAVSGVWQRTGYRLVRTGTKTILDLPIECVAKVFTFLSDRDKCRAASACRFFSQAARTPHLWSRVCVDSGFLNLSSKFPDFLFSSRDRNESKAFSLRKKHIFHLTSRNASIRDLTYELYVDQYQHTLKKLLDAQHCSNLEKLSVTCYDICTTRGEAFARKLEFVSDVLRKAHSLSPGIKSLRMRSCQLLVLPEKLELLFKFQHLQHLEVQLFLKDNVHLSGETLERLFTNFPCLTTLELEVDSTLDYKLPGRVNFRMACPTLQHLRLYYSPDFRPTSINMPNLKTFSIKYWTDFSPHPRRVVFQDCLFEMIVRGCPGIASINQKEVLGLVEEYREDPERVKLLSVCYCPRHGMAPPPPGAINIMVYFDHHQ
ncbi:uncharacterized protein LOC144902753 [Branchiostoma floridae x Branchiostoma belcheri]